MGSNAVQSNRIRKCAQISGRLVYFIMSWMVDYETRGSLIRNDAPP